MSVVYGTPYAKCRYCGKYVRLTGWFARLHVCVSPEARRFIDLRNARIRDSQLEQIKHMHRSASAQIELLKERKRT